jgi:hypothetical protein
MPPGEPHRLRPFQVAVQDAVLVREVDGPGHVRHEPGRLAGPLDQFGDPPGQAAALDQPHLRPAGK